jgi:hypothetical protein
MVISKKTLSVTLGRGGPAASHARTKEIPTRANKKTRDISKNIDNNTGNTNTKKEEEEKKMKRVRTCRKSCGGSFFPLELSNPDGHTINLIVHQYYLMRLLIGEA